MCFVGFDVLAGVDGNNIFNNDIMKVINNDVILFTDSLNFNSLKDLFIHQQSIHIQFMDITLILPNQVFVANDGDQRADVDYYNFTEPAQARLRDVVAMEWSLLQGKVVVMAADCDASGISQSHPFPLTDTQVLDLSGCTGLDQETLCWILQAPSLRLLGLQGVDNITELRKSLNAADLDRFYAKAVWLPSSKLFCSPEVKD